MNNQTNKKHVDVKKRKIDSNSTETSVEQPKTPSQNDDVVVVDEAVEIVEMDKIKTQQIVQHKPDADDSAKKYNISLLSLVNDLSEFYTNDDFWRKKVARLTTKSCKSIISLLSKNKPQEIRMNIDVTFFKTLLLRWKGWSRCADLTVIQLYANLYDYLLHNWGYIEPLFLNFIDDINKKNTFQEERIVVCCNLKWLKSLFYFNAVGEHVYNLNPPKHQWEKNISTECLSNWPFVSIRMTLPNFEMVHTNHNHDEFVVVNLSHRLNNFIAGCPINTQLHYKHSKFTDTYISSFVITYISQLKFMLTHQSVIPIKKRGDIITVLNEFTKDLVLANDSVDTNTEYYANLTPHPYVRYLGDSTPPPPYLADKDSIVVRLKQITYPGVKFQLVKFSCPYKESEGGKISFIMNDNFVSNSILSNCLTYECTLCNLTYSSFLAPYELSVHIVNDHGFEPNWLCSFCGLSFTTEDLSVSRWSHNCKYNL